MTTPPPSTAVDVIGVNHAYTRAEAAHRILSDIHLSVARGETVALVGASGSGKSTLLNLIGGLEPVQSGDVQLFGESLLDLDDRERTLLRRSSIGFVHQAFNLISTLSVADNVALPLSLAGVAAPLRRQRQRELLEAVGLGGRDDDWPDRLSGGEQQRVAIARALAAQPPLILADEPTGNLDANSGERVMQLLWSLTRDQHATLVIVTHSLKVAGYADRVLALQSDGLQPVDATAADRAGAW